MEAATERHFYRHSDNSDVRHDNKVLEDPLVTDARFQVLRSEQEVLLLPPTALFATHKTHPVTGKNAPSPPTSEVPRSGREVPLLLPIALCATFFSMNPDSISVSAGPVSRPQQPNHPAGQGLLATAPADTTRPTRHTPPPSLASIVTARRARLPSNLDANNTCLPSSLHGFPYLPRHLLW